MLTPIDVHYLVGFLSSVGEPDDVELELGALVWDSSSETRRDVDVSVTRRSLAGIECFRGIEVKAERRALDVIAVEQLCAKLNDMPGLTTRAIVSASGYTEPAVRKAEKHGVELLSIEDLGEDRRVLGSTVFSPAFTMTNDGFEPVFHIAFEIQNRHREPIKLSNRTPVLDLNGRKNEAAPDVGTLAQLVSRQVAAACRVEAPYSSMPPDVSAAVDRFVNFEEAVYVLIKGLRYPIQGAHVTGTLRRKVQSIKPQFKTLLRYRDRNPFVDCLVAEMPDGALLLAAAKGVPSKLTLCQLPPTDRNRTKIRTQKWPTKAKT